jgi:hypothetical protein
VGSKLRPVMHELTGDARRDAGASTAIGLLLLQSRSRSAEPSIPLAARALACWASRRAIGSAATASKKSSSWLDSPTWRAVGSVPSPSV